MSNFGVNVEKLLSDRFMSNLFEFSNLGVRFVFLFKKESLGFLLFIEDSGRDAKLPYRL